MNANTIIKNEVVLCCGHIVIFEIRPYVKDVILCVKCDRGATVLTVTRIGYSETAEFLRSA